MFCVPEVPLSKMFCDSDYPIMTVLKTMPASYNKCVISCQFISDLCLEQLFFWGITLIFDLLLCICNFFKYIFVYDLHSNNVDC